MDIAALVGAVTRTVEQREVDGKPARAVVATRTYDTGIDDLWDALTSAERLPRWFLPITGDLTVGGRYQLQGNAGGVVERCDPPREFAITWEMFGAVSWVVVTLAAEGEGTRLTLDHCAIIDPSWDGRGFGSGATGIGWDLGLIGLELHVRTRNANDAAQFQTWTLSDEGKAFVRGASDGWGAADVAAHSWPRDEALARAEATRKFYSGET